MKWINVTVFLIGKTTQSCVDPWSSVPYKVTPVVLSLAFLTSTALNKITILSNCYISYVYFFLAVIFPHDYLNIIVIL